LRRVIVIKKLTTLVALILCVTVGGVYAAWLYTSETLTSVDKTLSHGMTTATQEGDAGVLSIESNNVVIAIDQKAPGDYTAVLKVTGEVQVRFTPNAGAPDDVKDAAIPAEALVYVHNADVNKYEDKPIYQSTGVKCDVNWVKQPDGSFLATISTNNIASLFELGGTFVLPTHDDYTAFHALEEKITITLAIQKKA